MTDFLVVLQGVFKFWDEISVVVKYLQKTPEEKILSVREKVKNAFDEKKNNGRPIWDVD